MPTTRPRHFVTETDDLSRALDDAARRWPKLSRSQLIVRLALKGHDATGIAEEEQRRERLQAVLKHSGALTGTYGPTYLSDLRNEWPE